MYLREFLQPLLFFDGWIEASLEKRENIPGNGGVFEERFGNMLLRIDNAGLAQITGIGAQHGHFTHGQAAGEDQAVEVVVIHLAGEGGKKSLFSFCP